MTGAANTFHELLSSSPGLSHLPDTNASSSWCSTPLVTSLSLVLCSTTASLLVGLYNIQQGTQPHLVTRSVLRWVSLVILSSPHSQQRCCSVIALTAQLQQSGRPSPQPSLPARLDPAVRERKSSG